MWWCMPVPSPSFLEVEIEGSEVQRHPRLHRVFQTSMHYVRPAHLEKEKIENVERRGCIVKGQEKCCLEVRSLDSEGSYHLVTLERWLDLQCLPLGNKSFCTL